MKFILCTCVFLAVSVPVVSNAKVPKKAVTQWNGVALRGVRDAKMGAPMAARALAIVHTCMYDAWATYDDKATGTQLSGALRRPVSERTEANKQRAVSYAAYRALTDVLSVDTESVFKPLMRQLGYDPNDHSTDIETPTGIGNVACGAVLEYRHHDKSNQLGEMDSTAAENAGKNGIKMSALGAYSDWTGYRPVNGAGVLPAHFPSAKPLNPDHWQPLSYTDSSGNLVVQMFAAPQWCFITPFAMTKGDDFRSALEPGPFKYGSPEYEQQAEELVELSANLTDRQKMIAEYWSGEANGAETLEHWLDLAQFVSSRDHHTLDDDVKMYFALSNALLDASIATWDAKRAYDSVRPVTAISLLFNGKKIRAWGGPGKGAIEMDGSQWLPYQPVTFPTPPSPEFPSYQSASSVAAARILALWTGSDRLGDSTELPRGSSKIEPGITPRQTVVLKWNTFTQAADEAGMSSLYSGINFRRANLAGRTLGRAVADSAWAKAQTLFDGTVKPELGEKASMKR
ncbi:MAG: vanadium-dependent haloperoxidase [Candidatus Acidiferrum sp.]